MAIKMRCLLCGKIYQTIESEQNHTTTNGICDTCIEKRQQYIDGDMHTGNDAEWRSNIRKSTGG